MKPKMNSLKSASTAKKWLRSPTKYDRLKTRTSTKKDIILLVFSSSFGALTWKKIYTTKPLYSKKHIPRQHNII